MPDLFDVMIIGAGPAGMSAAVRARSLGLHVSIVDEQSAPGGQIWREVERTVGAGHAHALGEDYAKGVDAVARFRACDTTYMPDTTVWQVERLATTGSWRVFTKRGAVVRTVDTRALLIATGAMERPVPFPGWTLPGVMTVGAAQILMKTAGQIPDAPVWIAGNGPLLLLYVNQLLHAGGTVAGVLHTTRSSSRWKGLAHTGRVLGSLHAWRDVVKGLRWHVRMDKLNVIDRVVEIAAMGDGRLESLTYRTASGAERTVASKLLLVHEGVIPDTQLTHALQCDHVWNEAQQCFAPSLDAWGRSSQAGIYVAGDGGSIAGANAAAASGEIAAVAIAEDLSKLTRDEAQHASTGARAQYVSATALRPLLDSLYAPRAQGMSPRDETIVCRCESVTAGEIRAAIRDGARDPNHVKAQTRCAMGPCLGRQCGTLLSHLVAQATGRSMADVGLARARPPLRPITLAELASLIGAPNHG